jgi:phosphopantothenoylcysteine synthetase/decarboxylase
MRWLVTAGGTVVPIDRVRSISNGFTGRTGAAIAAEAQRRGHDVTLLTSHRHTVAASFPAERVRDYRTFDDLQQLLSEFVPTVECVVHSSAVSDYRGAGLFATAPGTRFDATDGTWHGKPPALISQVAPKVSSDKPGLWLRLVKTPKLIDLVRAKWHFRGVLVKFKLEVGIDDAALVEIAERSRRQSDADLMVANTLEGARDWAFLGPLSGKYERVPRAELAEKLVTAVDSIVAERGHG